MSKNKIYTKSTTDGDIKIKTDNNKISVLVYNSQNGIQPKMISFSEISTILGNRFSCHILETNDVAIFFSEQSCKTPFSETGTRPSMLFEGENGLTLICGDIIMCYISAIKTSNELTLTSFPDEYIEFCSSELFHTILSGKDLIEFMYKTNDTESVKKANYYNTELYSDDNKLFYIIDITAPKITTYILEKEYKVNSLGWIEYPIYFIGNDIL